MFRIMARRKLTENEIEKQKPHMAHGVFDVVAKDPQKDHVADQMEPRAMQEHMAQERYFRRNKGELGRARHHPHQSGRYQTAGIV